MDVLTVVAVVRVVQQIFHANTAATVTDDLANTLIHGATSWYIRNVVNTRVMAQRHTSVTTTSTVYLYCWH